MDPETIKDQEARAAEFGGFVIFRAHDEGESWEPCFCRLDRDPAGCMVLVIRGTDDDGDVYMMREGDFLGALDAADDVARP